MSDKSNARKNTGKTADTTGSKKPSPFTPPPVGIAPSALPPVGIAPGGCFPPDVQRTSIQIDDRPSIKNPILVIHPNGWAEVLCEADLNLVVGNRELQVLGLPDADNFIAGSLRLDGISGPGDVTEVDVTYEPPTSGGLSDNLPGMEVEVHYGDNGAKSQKGNLLVDRGDYVELRVGRGNEARGIKLRNVDRIDYPCLPGNFREDPVVLLNAQATAAGKYQALLRFATRGLVRALSYEVELNRETKRGNIKGTANLLNNSSVTWFDATVVFVQGDTGAPQPELQNDQYEAVPAAAMMRSVQSVTAQQLDSGDVKLYKLPGKIRMLKNNSQKTVTVVRADDVPVEIEYHVDLQNYWWRNGGRNAGKKPVSVHLTWTNEEGGPINQTLFGAAVTVREKSEDLPRSLQCGQGVMADLPVGDDADVAFSTGIDVQAEVAVIGKPKKVTEKVSGGDDDDKAREQKYELRTCQVTLTNRSKRQVKYVVNELFVPGYGELDKGHQGSKFEVVSGGRVKATVTVNAGEEQTLKYVVKVPVN
jgi:hypothetical protein